MGRRQDHLVKERLTGGAALAHAFAGQEAAGDLLAKLTEIAETAETLADRKVPRVVDRELGAQRFAVLQVLLEFGVLVENG